MGEGELPGGSAAARARTALSDECAALIKQVRARCPGLLPADPLPPGRPTKPVPIDSRETGSLVGVAVRQAAAFDATGHLPPADELLPRVVVWQDGEASLAVELAKVSTETAEGRVVVTVPVRCDQLPEGRELVTVTFAVGAPGRPAGLLAATPQVPEGPDVVVRRWADALLSLAWRALLDAVSGVAGAVGADTDGAPLVVTALAASDQGLEVLAQARHPFDRAPLGRAVRPR